MTNEPDASAPDTAAPEDGASRPLAGSPEYLAAIERVRLLIEQDGRSKADLAREAAIAGSTFAAWYGGTYKGDVTRVTRDVTRWLDTRDSQVRTRCAQLPNPGFVSTPTSKVFLSAFEHAQHTPDLVLMMGNPGVGKTTAAKEYAGRNKGVHILTAEPVMKTARNVISALAEQLGVGGRSGGHDASRAVMQRLADLRGLLIVDEAQHIAADGLEQLRALHDAAEIGIALMGNDSAYLRIEQYRTHSNFGQFYSRIGLRVIKRSAALADAEALLDAFDVRGIKERKMLTTVSTRSGALRSMVKTLRSAHLLAIAEGLDHPRVEHIKMAFENLAARPMEGE